MTGGRPLRFLAVTLGGWTVLRLALLWPDAEHEVVAPAIGIPPALASAIPPPHASSRPEREPSDRQKFALPTRPARRQVSTTTFFHPRRTVTGSIAVAVSPSASLPSALSFAALAVSMPSPTQVAAPLHPPAPISTAFSAAPSRLAGSAWALVRDGGGGAFAGGRLGGAQAGARLTYALGEARRVSLAARVSSPLAGRGQEAALGLDWRPTRLPLHLVAEQRFALDRAASAGPALSVVGGLDPLPVVAAFRLEAYGQAGVVARAGRFVDGAVRLGRPVAAFGPARLEIGAGAWGGAQRGAARLDVGPGAVLIVPLGERGVRVSLDWRQRVAGHAAPGSGPVLSIGQDF